MNEPARAPAADPVVARFAAGLLDQHRLVEAALRKGSPNFEWQPAPGRNSIGMLLAHNAIVEVWWLDVGARGEFRNGAETFDLDNVVLYANAQ